MDERESQRHFADDPYSYRKYAPAVLQVMHMLRARHADVRLCAKSGSAKNGRPLLNRTSCDTRTPELTRGRLEIKLLGAVCTFRGLRGSVGCARRASSRSRALTLPRSRRGQSFVRASEACLIHC